MLFAADAPHALWYGTTAGGDGEGEFDLPWGNNLWDVSNPSQSTTPTENDGSIKRVKRSRRTHRHQGSDAVATFDHLIASAHDRHSARDLCEDEYSHGPDFMSFSEGIFCDMGTKMHWPLCANGTKEDECYHGDTHSLVLGEERQARNYSSVVEWE